MTLYYHGTPVHYIKIILSCDNKILLPPAIVSSLTNKNKNTENMIDLTGAYLLSAIKTKTNYCASCGANKTSLWRKGWYDPLLNRPVHLCNACGLKFCKMQYCPYCKYVYSMHDLAKEKFIWTTCLYCSRYAHNTCICLSGQTKNKNNNSYICPKCIEYKRQQQRQQQQRQRRRIKY